MTRTWLPLLLLAACAPDLRDDHPFDGEVKTGPLVTVEVQPDGSRLAVIDATNKGSQVYVDLDADTELKADAAFSSNAWDLAFKRFEIFMNGGTSGPTGTVTVAVLDGQDFDALTKAPADGYQQDGQDVVFAKVLGGWYDYDLNVHKVVPKPNLLYVVKSSSGTYFALKLLGYYDATGTPAMISAKYKPLSPP
jgi:hypothetical protein